MNNELEQLWYVAAVPDMRVRTNPKKPVTYWLVTYRPPIELLEIRFVYEQVGGNDPTRADWQRIVREHFSTVPVS